MTARDELWQQPGLAERAPAWVDAAPDLVAWLDADLHVLYANREFEAATGCPVERWRGAALPELRPFGEATSAVVALATTVRDDPGRESAKGEVDWRVDDDTERRLVATAFAEHGPGGAVDRILLTATDVTAFWLADRNLRHRESEFRTLAENSPDNIIRYDLDGYATYCNQEIAQRVNTTATSVLGKRPTESAPPGMTGADEYERVLIEALRTGEPGRVTVTVNRPDGAQATHSILIRAEFDAAGAITGAIAIGRDVSDLAEARRRASDREREFRTLAENAGDQIARWDTAGRFIYANPRMLALFGASAGKVLGSTTSELLGDGGDAAPHAISQVVRTRTPEMVEVHVPDPEGGSPRIHQVLYVPELDEHGEVVSVLGVGRDITESVRYREDLERLAHTDLLTGLPNSQALYAWAPAMLAAASRSGRRAAVLLVDLDGFKAINDTLGHAGGDRVLKALADRVRSRLRPYDLFARLGGDEFVIVIDDLDPPHDLAAVSTRIMAAVTDQVGGESVQTRASIGVAVYPEDGDSIEVLVQHADMAMYQAKRAGRARIEYFRPELSRAMQRRSTIERGLDDPDVTEQLEVHVQPVFGMDASRPLTGAEALLRWNHPVLGPVTPGEFIPIAEESGAIVRLGRWVLHQACAAAARWNAGRSGDDVVMVAVNFSTRQFLLDDVAAAVDEAIGATGCEPAWLIAEITESLLLEDSDAVQEALASLRSRGIRIAIDDFGTGYSALHYLARFPLDVLKIDRSFVQGLGKASEHDEVVKALVALARALDLRVVAEGIETAAQLEFLTAQRCEHGQGFLLGRPVPVDQFETEHGLG
ncbi:EAL domain-containing protein [Actinotalea sp. M2MS4P-6]|uniref:sensor domain-containing protein n=1 Tax=Actinotalea sp. M2MS4P-6 TaxID=2983762 RepID=UPI0021E4BA8D|nr:EAL domain-containing protein [Actinotalea sp. M2MS4P-6]MCV2395388.1 EAL domain-containing protein [Actinotalea sp. M2MS4P-6]